MFAASVCELDPLCQHALAYQSIAQYGLNKKDDTKHLTDFATMIFKARISAPSAFDGAEFFNEALDSRYPRSSLADMGTDHRVTRGGSVTKDLTGKSHRTTQSVERALRVTIDEFRELLSADKSSVFGAAPEEYRLTLIASILKAGGRHRSHIHEGAWLSGVYYASVPDVISDNDESHAGWLEFDA